MPGLLKGKVDGRLEIGDLGVALAAMATTAVAFAVMGSGAELALLALGLELSTNRLLAWLAIGLVAGGGVAAWRILVDLLFDGQERPRTVTVHTNEGPAEVPGIITPPYGVEVVVHNRQQLFIGHLLEDKQRVEAAAILRKVANAVINEGAAFSKRGAARFLGENATAVRDELARLGLIAKQGSKANSTWSATTPGLVFFEACLEEPFPDDPISIHIP